MGHMELSGQIVFDPKWGFQLHNGEKFFHELLGGKTYYVSRSGKTIKGWIPARPGRQVVQWYNPQNPVALENISEDYVPRVGGYAIMVPLDGDQIDHGYPVVAEKDGNIYFFAIHEWRDFLLGKALTMNMIEFDYSYWSFELQRKEETSYVGIDASHKVEKYIAKRLAMYLVRDQMLPPEEVQSQINDRSRYWEALGLLDLGDGYVYRVSKGILLERFERSDLPEEKIRKIAPGPITLLGSGELGSPGIVQEDKHYLLVYPDEQGNRWLDEAEALCMLISGKLPSAE